MVLRSPLEPTWQAGRTGPNVVGEYGGRMGKFYTEGSYSGVLWGIIVGQL